MLPLDILQDNIGDLEHLFGGGGEKWHIIVHIRSASESNSMQQEEKVPMHTNNQGVSAGATCKTPIGKLKLFVKSQTGETTEFIVKKTMKMEKLFTPLRR